MFRPWSNRRRQKANRRGDRNDHHLLHPLRDRPVRQTGLRAICACLGPGHPALRRRPDRLFRADEGSATTAYAAYSVESLAAYEAYRARLAADPVGKANYEYARRENFILKEDRIFLKLVSGPHGPRQVFRTDVTVKGGIEA